MTTLLWFRRDLRLHDLPPLLDAVANGDEVLACFVLDPRLEASSGQRRMQFLCNSLQQLRNDLDGRLLVTRGRRPDGVSARRCRDAATAADRLHAQPFTDDHGVVSGEGSAFAMA